jgi:MscS family membrane protein
MVRVRARIAALLLCTLLMAAGLAHAQAASSLTKALKGSTQPAAPASDNLGRETPAGTVYGFLQATQNGDYRTAAQYLKLTPSKRLSQGDELAAQLSADIDRAFVGLLKNISNQPEGLAQAGVPPDQQKIGSLSAGDVDVDVVLLRVNDPSAGKIWLFAPSTLEKVPDVYDQLQARQIETRMPKPLVTLRPFGMPLWQWLAVLLAIPLAAAVSGLFLQLLVFSVNAWRKRYHPELPRRPFRTVSSPLWLLLATLAHGICVFYIRLPLLHRHYYVLINRVVFLIALTWVILRGITLFMRRAREKAVARGRTGTGTLMLLGQRMVKAAIVVIAVFTILTTLGFNMTTALAGLGIGGIAVAFAAQKTLENLFGGITLLGDEVLRVGDTCRVGDRVGTVEDISLRSTRLRTPERSELSIPNGSLATVNLENLSRRDKILFSPKLAIRHETSAEQMRFVLAELRRLLYEHPKVEAESARVRLADFSDSALTLEVFAYILTTDYAEFAAIREDVLLRMMDIVEKSGSGFAVPAQRLYVARDGGLHDSKTDAAVAQVQKWRDAGELPFPDYKPEDVSSFRGAITYPPPDSALGKKP